MQDSVLWGKSVIANQGPQRCGLARPALGILRRRVLGIRGQFFPSQTEPETRKTICLLEPAPAGLLLVTRSFAYLPSWRPRLQFNTLFEASKRHADAIAGSVLSRVAMLLFAEAQDIERLARCIDEVLTFGPKARPIVSLVPSEPRSSLSMTSRLFKSDVRVTSINR